MRFPDYYHIGRINRPHGLKGEVTVQLNPGLPNDVSSLNLVFVQMNDHLVPHFITSVSRKGDKAYFLFEDIDQLEKAQAIAKCDLFLPKDQRPKLKGSEFYDDEIIGFVVEDQTAGILGAIKEVIQSGPQRLISVDYNDKDVLIPINGPFIKKIDRQKKKMITLLPEGFLDL